MTKRKLCTIILFFAIHISIFSQQQVGIKTLLWEVSGNGLQKPSYIFGTMHLLCESDTGLGDSLEIAIANTDAVFFEIDLDDMVQMLGMINHLNMKNGKSLTDYLSISEYYRVMKGLEKMRIPFPKAMVKRMKPLFVSGMISESFFDCPGKKGMEEVIMKFAKKNNKNIKGLETVAFQASLFDSIPYEEQAKELLNYIDSVESFKVKTKQLAEVYKRQDLAEIEKLSTESEPGMERYLDLLLYQRNRNWALKFKDLSLKESSLIAVGAGHLSGDRGLLNLLKRLGYNIRPVENRKKKGTYQTIVP